MDEKEINRQRGLVADMCDLENIYLTCSTVCDRTKELLEDPEDPDFACKNCILRWNEEKTCLKQLVETRRLWAAKRALLGLGGSLTNNVKDETK